MRKFSIEERLKRIFKKIHKKDRITYESVMSKMREILTYEDINHYKNLRKPLQHLKRAHIKGPLVLTFKYAESEDKVVFYDFDHHDNIYR